MPDTLSNFTERSLKEIKRFFIQPYGGCPPCASVAFLFSSANFFQHVPLIFARNTEEDDDNMGSSIPLAEIGLRLFLPYITYKLIWLPSNNYLHNCIRLILGEESHYLELILKTSSMILGGLCLLTSFKYTYDIATNSGRFNDDDNDNDYLSFLQALQHLRPVGMQLQIDNSEIRWQNVQFAHQLAAIDYQTTHSLNAGLDRLKTFETETRHLLSSINEPKYYSDPVLAKEKDKIRPKTKHRPLVPKQRYVRHAIL